MVWVRGHARDYDDWHRQGLKGWAFCEVLPYFRRLENYHREDAFRGREGFVGVTRGQYPNPLFDAYVESGRQAGFPVTEDFNGRQFEGFGRYDMNIWRGRRQSASATYLSACRNRGNLTVRTGTLVSRIVVEKGKATGIEVASAGEARGAACRPGGHSVRRRDQLAATAAAVGNRRPAASARERDRCRGSLPGVGLNLQDHLNTSVKHECLKPVTLYGADRFPRNALIGLEYLLFKTGAGATMHTEAGCFVKAMPGSDIPDIQHHFIPPSCWITAARQPTGTASMPHLPSRPVSRGTIRLARPIRRPRR